MRMESERGHRSNLLIRRADCETASGKIERILQIRLTSISEFRDGFFLGEIPHLDDVEGRSTASSSISDDSKERRMKLTSRKSEHVRERRAGPFRLDEPAQSAPAPSSEYPTNRPLLPNYEHNANQLDFEKVKAKDEPSADELSISSALHVYVLYPRIVIPLVAPHHIIARRHSSIVNFQSTISESSDEDISSDLIARQRRQAGVGSRR